MSDYVYTDRDGDHLSVGKSKDDHGDVFIEVYNEANIHAVAVRADDAPDVALAILEAANLRDCGDSILETAVDAVNAAVLHNKIKQHERAVQEAEDAKVREWFHVCWPGEYPTNDFPVDDNDRRAYRAGRKFFEES